MMPAMTQTKLEAVFDQVAREVTKRTTGICLYAGTEAPTGDLCTVYTRFSRGAETSISLCAEDALFTRLTRYMMQSDEVTRQDVEDFSKEYFNVLCGHLAFGIFQASQVRPRFSPPAFFRGRYQPEGHNTHFALRYTSDAREKLLLTHHTPITAPSCPAGRQPF